MVVINSPQVVIIGSFRSCKPEIEEAAIQFRRLGAHIASPQGEITGTEEDSFRLLSSDPNKLSTQLQKDVFDKIRSADLVYLVPKSDGSVGSNTNIELGIALENEKLILSSRPTIDMTGLLTIDSNEMKFTQASPEEAMQILTGKTTDQMIQSAFHVFFELDNTLVENAVHVLSVQSKIKKLLEDASQKNTDFEKRLEHERTENIRTLGRGLTSYATALNSAFQETLHLDVNPLLHDTLKGSFRVALNFFMKNVQYPEPVDKALDTLNELRKEGFTTHLLTLGNEKEQAEKADRVGMHDLFDSFDFVQDKTRETFIETALRHKFEPKRCVMVGNDPKFDIFPALSATWFAIYIPSEYDNSTGNGTLEKARELSTFRQVNSISEIIPILSAIRASGLA